MRRVLFVGAPFGSFFRSLATELKSRGVVAWRTVSDGGDLVETPAANRVIFRGSIDAWVPFIRSTIIDKHINAKLKQMSILPSGTCTDDEFVRRSYLDCIGRVPTPDETKAFMADKGAKKRDLLIDKLVETAEFADFWAMKWADILRTEEKVLDTPGVEA